MTKRGWARGRGAVGPIALAMAVAMGVGVGVARQLGAGDVARAITLDQNPSAVALDARTGRAFVALQAGGPGTHGHILVIDSGAGRVIRAVTVGQVPNALAVDEATGHVLITDGSDADGSPMPASMLYTLDEQSGHVGRGLRLDGSVASMALDGPRGRLFTVGRGTLTGNWYGPGTMTIRDAVTARSLYTTTVGIYPSAVDVDARMGRAFVSNFLGNTVSILDARDGRTLRTVTLGVQPGRLAMVAADVPTHRVFALELPPIIEGGPQPSLGSVAMIDAATGRLLRTVPLREPMALAVGARTGNVLAATNGGLLVLDGRTVATGLSPTAIAVDGRAGRVVLVTGAGAARDPDPWAWVPGPMRKLPFIPAPPMHFHDVPGHVSIIDLPR